MIPGWKEDIQSEYLEFVRKNRRVTPADLASHFNMSECCAVYWLTDLARDGRVRILSFELVEDGQTPCGPEIALTCQRKAFCPVPDEAKSPVEVA